MLNGCDLRVRNPGVKKHMVGYDTKHEYVVHKFVNLLGLLTAD